ncbi:M23 family metallopeptidase [Chryseobacterium sp. POL2]|uniref:M23 family metallopeptidase n=1 Tax=Chryseobacterium sp. POL2 TaxID=2713414 RepID=UPI0013E101C7|nr:M23 family metallopeptidase [Chryseobacterium sp. POL2]QIG89140.1 M23 family metallopeptidase [Chryseobacterium sp. POL2]
MVKNLLFLLLPCYFFSQEDLDIKIEKEKNNSDIILYVTNNEYAPVSIEFTFEGKNVNSTLADKSVMVIPAKSDKIKLTHISPIQKKQAYNFNYKTYYVLGDVNNAKSDDYEYWLPYEKNTSQSIYQAYNGSFSHQNAYSLDFSHKIGTKVLASRAGKVVFVKIDSDKSCLTKSCSEFNNKIVVLHNDGTLAEYVHLKKNGSLVAKGDDVERGQVIGYSGNTGWSKGPHLHFSVYNNKINADRIYYKTKFRVKDQKNPIILEDKKIYSRDY